MNAKADLLNGKGVVILILCQDASVSGSPSSQLDRCRQSNRCSLKHKCANTCKILNQSSMPLHLVGQFKLASCFLPSLGKLSLLVGLCALWFFCLLFSARYASFFSVHSCEGWCPVLESFFIRSALSTVPATDYRTTTGPVCCSSPHSCRSLWSLILCRDARATVF